MGSQGYVNLTEPFHSAAGAAIGSFTTITDVSPTKPLLGAEVLSLPGKKIHVRAQGEYSCATGVTLGLGVFLGTTAAAWVSAQFTTGTTPTAWPWFLEMDLEATGQGSANPILGQGWHMLGSSLTAFNLPQAIPATQAARTVNVNTTGALYAGIAAVFSASAAGNTVKTNHLNVYSLN